MDVQLMASMINDRPEAAWPCQCVSFVFVCMHMLSGFGPLSVSFRKCVTASLSVLVVDSNEVQLLETLNLEYTDWGG